MCPAVLLMYFTSAAVILLASLALKVQVSLPYNNTGRASVLYNFIYLFSLFLFVRVPWGPFWVSQIYSVTVEFAVDLGSVMRWRQSTGPCL